MVTDAGRLKQILYNYLSNALKFTNPVGRIQVIVWTEDSGIGIAAEDIPRLFSEFGQLGKSETSKSGSGLGLAISKNIAEAQGGRVGVKSELGRGSTFFVVLPRSPKTTDASGTASADVRPIETCLSERRSA